jgi:membrane-bound lytic murein transglycosylase B
MVRMYRAILIALFFAAPLCMFAETQEERRTRLEAELAAIEVDIEGKRGDLTTLQRERTSLERDIAILDNKISAAKLSLKQRDIAITRLLDDIGSKEAAIESIDQRVEKGEESLAQLLRRTREIDDVSLVELALGEGTISRFFEEVDSFEQIQSSLDASFRELLAMRSDLATRKDALETRKIEEEDLRRIQLMQKQKIEQDEKEKQRILRTTKGQEKEYQKLIAEREREAATIRSALFSLRDSGAIPFGTAYQYAREASAQTGVRPALILAVLRQETNLGENVGQCLLTNSPNKGDGIGKNTGRAFKGVMKGTRDVDPFMEITQELGIDPYSQVVSCPPGYGYGGAMGPAQFIPSTWMLYKERLSRLTGTNPPNPWDPRTAIFATALLMLDNGADKGTRQAERLAALRYFAGWGNANKPAYAFYGDSVVEFADQYQRDIDVLER